MKYLGSLFLFVLAGPVASFVAPSISNNNYSGRFYRKHTKIFAEKATNDIATKTDNESSIAKFVGHVKEAIDDQSFISLTLRGTSTKKKKDKRLRGSVRIVDGRLIEVKKKAEPLLQLTIKFHGATDLCRNLDVSTVDKELAKILFNPPTSEWGEESILPFQGAELVTLNHLWTLNLLHKKGKLKKTKSTVQSKSQVRPETHDRTKQVPLADTKDTSFLKALGLTKPDGMPRPGMASKLRQCNKFVEIVAGLIRSNPTDQEIKIVDMGCGRGYLTFSLHSYLSEKHAIVKSIGIDVRPKLVAEIEAISKSLGGSFETLSFQTGTIEDIVGDGKKDLFGGETTKTSYNVLIALHACDTATDDALWSGISQDANVIVVAPCCHREIRSQVNLHVSATKEKHPLYDILKHGVYRERLSETITDSLRALLLQKAGYNVQVFEFIGGEHTSKNVMITAVKTEKSAPDDIETRIQELASFHGITQQKLANFMDTDLMTISQGDSVPTVNHALTATQMPRK